MPRIIVSLAGRTLYDQQLEPGSYSFGRKAANDFHLNDKVVSGTHARFVVGADTLLDDLCSTNGTFVNGEKVERAILSNGDVITMGNAEIVYHSDGAPVPHAVAAPNTPTIKEKVPHRAVHLASNPCVEVVSGAREGEVIVLDKPFTAIGKIGVRVAVITKSNQGFGVRPVSGNSDPVKLNGKSLGIKMEPLKDKDKIEIAGMTMVFHMAGS